MAAASLPALGADPSNVGRLASLKLRPCRALLRPDAGDARAASSPPSSAPKRPPPLFADGLPAPLPTMLVDGLVPLPSKCAPAAIICSEARAP